jgi:hypothetical protein
MMRRRAGGLLVASLLTLCLCGCYSGETIWTGLSLVAGSGAKPRSGNSFVARARKLCKEALFEAERNALGVVENKARLYIRHGDLQEFKISIRHQEISTMLAPALHRRTERVMLLGIPEEDRTKVYEILRAVDEISRGAEVGTPYLLVPKSRPIRRVRALAASYGIESCGVLYRYHGLYDRGTTHPAVRLVPKP